LIPVSAVEAVAMKNRRHVTAGAGDVSVISLKHGALERLGEGKGTTPGHRAREAQPDHAGSSRCWGVPGAVG
jgi:hypothetical protein